jgi:hypothetical protein
MSFFKIHKIGKGCEHLVYTLAVTGNPVQAVLPSKAGDLVSLKLAAPRRYVCVYGRGGSIALHRVQYHTRYHTPAHDAARVTPAPAHR